MADLGDKRRDWHGRRGLKVSVLCQAGHLGAKDDLHASVYRHTCAQSLRAPLFVFTHLVWGPLGETKLTWAESCTVVRVPEDQYGELWHWPFISGSPWDGA